MSKVTPISSLDVKDRVYDLLRQIEVIGDLLSVMDGDHPPDPSTVIRSGVMVRDWAEEIRKLGGAS